MGNEKKRRELKEIDEKYPEVQSFIKGMNDILDLTVAASEEDLLWRIHCALVVHGAALKVARDICEEKLTELGIDIRTGRQKSGGMENG